MPCARTACCASIWAKSVENVPKSLSSRVLQLRSLRALPGRTARWIRTPWVPGSACIQLEVSRLDAVLEMELRKYAAERATEGVPSEVMEFET